MILLALVNLAIAVFAAWRWVSIRRGCADCGRPWADRIHLPCAVVSAGCSLGHHPYVGRAHVRWWGWLAVVAWLVGCWDAWKAVQ